MRTQEIEKIKQLVSTSPVLSDSERTEWLELLPMMTDKQLIELSSIITPSASTAPATEQFVPRPTAPQLSHIANLPSKIPLDFSAPPASPNRVQPPQGVSGSRQDGLRLRPPDSIPSPADKAAQFAKQLQQRVNEKELPSGLATPIAQPSPTPLRPGTGATFSSLPPRLTPREPSQSPSSHTPVAELMPKSSEVERNDFSSAADLEKLNLPVFRTLGAAHLLNNLRTLIKKTDYFEILFSFEKSPLYKAYLQAGKQALHNEGFKNQPQTPTSLSKQEFESLTDVLRQMQVG